MRHSTWLLPVLWLAIGGAVRGQADDPIEARLAKAKEAYAASDVAFRKAVAERIKAVEARATKAGDKRALDQAVADGNAFEANGTLPGSLKANDLQGKRTTARLELLAAFKRAISDYTKAQMQPRAQAVEEEMLEFKAGFAGEPIKPGTVWRGEKRYLKGGPAGLHPFELKVTKRDGATFQGIITEERLSHDIEGVVEGDKVNWAITRIRSGPYPGQPQSGTIENDEMNLYFARRDGDGQLVTEARGKILLQKKR